MQTQIKSVDNKDRKNASSLFIVSFVLVIIAIVIGTTFYPHEDGGPARLIGLVAFAFFILSLINLQRAKQGEQSKHVTSVSTYTKNIIIALILLPLYLFGSYMYLILSWAANSMLPAIAVLIGAVGLFALVFSKYKVALVCLGVFVIPGIVWAFIQ